MEDFDKTNVIVTGDIDPNVAGAFVWWRLAGDMNIEKLDEAWEREGLSIKLVKPAKPSASVALRRAVLEQATRRRLVRPLPKDRSGYAIVDEQPDTQKTLDYNVQCKVFFDEADQVQVEPHDSPLRDEILPAYARHSSSVSASDVREWLTGVVIPSVLALKLRDGGGVYFIPPSMLQYFRAIVRCIKWSSDHAIFAVPAMKTDDAVAGILDALRHEAETNITKLQEEIAKGDLGVRALKSRIDQCTEQEKKLTKYEEMLGQRQDGIREDLGKMRANLMEAIMHQGSDK